MPTKANQYDDPGYNYKHYWHGRDYEHLAEEVAIKSLLRGHRFNDAVDIGGGYGRLSTLLRNYASNVTLAEPSKKQLEIAAGYLRNDSQIKRELMQADKLNFDDKSLDLAVMVRVMHHLPDPTKEFKEIARVLKHNGYLVLEVANYLHARNRLKHFIKGQKFPEEPVDIRSKSNRRGDEVAFVNHNPKTVIKQLAHSGFKVERALSVSNLRSPRLKKMVPTALMISVERLLQPALANAYFGPSVFFLAKKIG